MPHVPLVIHALRASATGGVGGAFLDFLAQVCQKKALAAPKDDEEREEGEPEHQPIEALRMVQAFGIGAVLGNVVGTTMYGRKIHAKMYHILGTIGWTELVYAPLHVALLSGRGDVVEDNIPQLFGYSVFAVAGGVVWCDVLIHFKAMNPTSLRYVGHVKEAIESLGTITIGALMFTFTNKFTDCQRNKTIIDKSDTVVLIHGCAVTATQILGNLVAFSLCATPWFNHKLPVFWFPAMLLTPSFMLCTALNIENGVRSVEINGRTDPTPARRAEAQKRISIMQVLPLGALPSGFMKGHVKRAFVLLCGKFLAAMCASTYIAYQQQPWSKYLRKEKGEFRKVTREAGQEWGLEWEVREDEEGVIRLKSVAEGSPAAELQELVGRRLALCNDDKMTSVDAWKATAEEPDPPVLQLNLDFERKYKPKSFMESFNDMKQAAGVGGEEGAEMQAGGDGEAGDKPPTAAAAADDPTPDAAEAKDD